jgi:phasin family protein
MGNTVKKAGNMMIGASASPFGSAMTAVVVSCRLPQEARKNESKIEEKHPCSRPETEMTIMTTTAKKPDFEKLASDSAAFGKEQMDAYTKAAKALAKGGEELFRTYVALSQETAEKNAAALKALMGCKTLNELTEAQSKLAQESLEGAISNVTKLSELSVRIATESFEPINAQVTKAMKKVSESMAA